MSGRMSGESIRTLGYVLKRTNYGEADRILNIITPLGKISAIAKGVRREKSKLAGGVEMFSLIDFNIHQSRSGLGVITGAKMLQYRGGILEDYARMELAGKILKEVSRAAESSDSKEYFEVVEQGLKALDGAVDIRLVRGWFALTMLRISGEEVNLYRDVEGRKLEAGKCYEWDVGNEAFRGNDSGRYGTDEIKMLRLLATTEMKIVKRVKIEEEMLEKVMDFVDMLE